MQREAFCHRLGEGGGFGVLSRGEQRRQGIYFLWAGFARRWLFKPTCQRFDHFSLQSALPPLLQYLPGSISLACLDQRINITEPVLALIRVGFQCHLEVRQPGSGLLNLHRQHSQVMVRIRVTGLGLQNGTIKTFGVLQLASLVVCDGLLQVTSDLPACGLSRMASSPISLVDGQCGRLLR